VDGLGSGTRNRGLELIAVAAPLGLTLGAAAVDAETRRAPRIVNGLETTDFPTTGALLL